MKIILLYQFICLDATLVCQYGYLQVLISSNRSNTKSVIVQNLME